MNRISRGEQAFTLIEVLVVIAVIAALAGLMVPALGMMRVNANRSTCLSNERQIGLALQLYANDNSQAYPPTSHSTGRRHIEESWIFELADYLESVDKIRVCPADSPERQKKIIERKATSYVLNDLVFDDPKYAIATNIPLPSRTMILFNLSDNREPSQTWDHTHSAEWNSWSAALNDIEPDRHRSGKRSGDRLSGSANYLFADGHAENISAKDFKEMFKKIGNPAAVPTETRLSP